MDVHHNKLKAQIKALLNYGISDALVSRILVNYHIVTVENLMHKREYLNKDKVIKFIESNYQSMTT
jgi:hypothetical protein